MYSRFCLFVFYLRLMLEFLYLRVNVLGSRYTVLCFCNTSSHCLLLMKHGMNALTLISLIKDFTILGSISFHFIFLFRHGYSCMWYTYLTLGLSLSLKKTPSEKLTQDAGNDSETSASGKRPVTAPMGQRQHSNSSASSNSLTPSAASKTQLPSLDQLEVSNRGLIIALQEIFYTKNEASLCEAEVFWQIKYIRWPPTTRSCSALSWGFNVQFWSNKCRAFEQTNDSI